MGLDMYLYASDYISGYDFSPEEERNRAVTILNNVVVGKMPRPICASVEVDYQVAYWRKAKQIHNWFVNNVQDGVDDCRKSYVSVAHLRHLHDLCVDLLKRRDPKEAAQLLPTQSGFFFGGTDYDDYYYWQDLESTVEQLKPLIENEYWCDFYYRSSW